MKKLLFIFVLSFGLIFAVDALAAPSYTFMRGIIPELDSTYDLGTTTQAWRDTVSDRFCLTSDSCISTWSSAAGASDWTYDAALGVVRTSTSTLGARAAFFTGTSTTASTFAGNVGIGTTTPNSLLSISGSAPTLSIADTRNHSPAVGTVLANIQFKSDDLSNSLAGATRGSISAVSEVNTTGALTGLAFATHNGTDLSEVLRITSGGNVGIGTTTPTHKLVVEGGSTPSIDIASNDGTRTLLRFYESGANIWELMAGGPAFGTDTFQIREDAGTTRFTIASGGNVGIGSTTPYAKLSVTNTGTGPSFVVEDSTSPDSTPFIIDASGNVGIGTITPSGNFVINGTTGKNFFQVASSTNQNLLVIDQNGKLGIGQASDGNFLHVSGSADVSGNPETVANYIQQIEYTGFSTTGTGNGLVFTHDGAAQGSIVSTDKGSGNAGALDFYVDSGSGYPLAMRIDSTGNVGIGTTNPAGNLHISGTGAQLLLVESTSSATSTLHLRSGSLDGLVALAGGVLSLSGGASDNVPISLNASNATNQLYLATSGNVGIGSTTPNAKLTVENALTQNSFFVGDQALDTSPFIIDAAGAVGIGSSTPLSKLSVRSAGGTTGKGITVTSSADVENFWVQDNGTSYNRGNLGIGTTTPTTKLVVSALDPVLWLHHTSSADTAISNGMMGLALTAGAMNATSKYTPALKFGTTDASITTTNPRYPALIVGYTTDNWAADTDSGMGLEFFTTPNDAGTAPTPSSRMVINENGRVGIGTTTPTSFLQTFTTGTTTTSIDSNSATQGACQEFKDMDGVGYTYKYYNNGAEFVSTVSCK